MNRNQNYGGTYYNRNRNDRSNYYRNNRDNGSNTREYSRNNNAYSTSQSGYRGYRNNSDIYENEFSRYGDGFDDNYPTPAYSQGGDNYNSGKRSSHDDRNMFQRLGQRIKEGWNNMMDDDDRYNTRDWSGNRNRYSDAYDEYEDSDYDLDYYDEDDEDHHYGNSYGTSGRRTYSGYEDSSYRGVQRSGNNYGHNHQGGRMDRNYNNSYGNSYNDGDYRYGGYSDNSSQYRNANNSRYNNYNNDDTYYYRGYRDFDRSWRDAGKWDGEMAV